MEEKVCKKCGKTLPLENFHIDNGKKDKHKNICKECLSRKRGKPNLKLDKNIRQNIIYCLKHDGPFGWEKILGFSKKELKKHLESEFEEGMTFENYGKWGVSFHIPKRCYRFSSITSQDFKNCWSLKNLKPMWIEDTKKQKIKISKKELDKYGLWDILPVGDISNLLSD